MKKNAETITFGAVALFLCCYFMQIFDFPNILTVLLGGVLYLALVWQQKQVKIDLGICLLAVTMGSYYLIVNGTRGLLFSILYIPLVLYLVAGAAVGNGEDCERKTLLLIGAFVLGYGIHGILNAYMFYAGYVIPGTRQWQDFWTRAIVPGTQHTAYFLPALALFLPAVLYFRKKIGVSAILIAANVFFAYTSLATKSRMSVVIFAMVFFAQFLLFVLLEKERVKQFISDKRFKIGCAILILCLIVFAFLVKDSAVVVAFMDNMGKGGGILNNVRFQAQHLALEQLFDYPMGGRQMELGRTYCHNTWLDMANAAGLIPFFAFTAYTVYTGYEMIRLLFLKEISTEIKLVLGGLYLTFFLYFSVEPALDASIHLFTPFIFINGLLHGMLRHNHKKASVG